MDGPARLADLVRRLGGDLYDGGRRALVPGPGHGPRDRSVSLWANGDRILVHSFAGDDWLAVRRHLWRAGGGLGGSGGAAVEPAASSRPERLAVARTLWDTARPIAGALAERYARRRRIRRPLLAALRFHPAVPAAVYAGAGRRRPALLAAVRDAEGCLCAVEVTYLAADATAAAVRTPRKTVGSLPAGAAVRLDPAAETLAVAEGVFTALSAGAAFGLPVWALLSVGNLRRWRPPPGVRRLVIAADRGGPGESGAAALARAVRELGLAAVVRLPPMPFEDWNAWAAAQPEEGGEDGDGAGAPKGGEDPRPAQEPDPHD
jgi:putative DNA primase/helicase